MQCMMEDHLDLTLQEAVDYLSGNYAASIADYETVHLQILEMADMLSKGVINQFLGMFRMN